MTPLYHITHADNLPRIVADGGLLCVADLRQAGQPAYVDIAHGHIQDRRARKRVPCGPGGTLCDYVPFYFAPRSPMLYAISRGAVAGYVGGQKPIIHLVTEAEAIAQAGLPFVFTDGHAVIQISEFFTDLSDLGKVDWALMAQKYWSDTDEDGDRKRRRQAEFLVHKFLPWETIARIGVNTTTLAGQVQQCLQGVAHKPVVTVERSWYY